MNMKKTLVSAAIAMTIGTGVAPQIATADTLTFSWSGMFTMLDPFGAGFANTSIPAKGNNQYQTPITGTMTFNTVTGSGSGTLVPFEFFSGSLPAEATGITLQAIGDGLGNPVGSLVMANMLFNWNGTTGIPTSLVLDAAGMFAALPGMGVGDTTSGNATGFSALPASDGTYVGAAVPGTVDGPAPGTLLGYLGLGPNPVVTTAWNLTSTCTRGGVANDGACMSLSPSGTFPLVLDAASNPNDFVANSGGTIGGNPMIDGPFSGNNANFNITSLTLTSAVPEVPVPAAVWLFGSGLLGLVGIARRKKA